MLLSRDVSKDSYLTGHVPAVAPQLARPKINLAGLHRAHVLELLEVLLVVLGPLIRAEVR